MIWTDSRICRGDHDCLLDRSAAAGARRGRRPDRGDRRHRAANSGAVGQTYRVSETRKVFRNRKNYHERH